MNHSSNAAEGDSKPKSGYDAPSRLGTAIGWCRDRLGGRGEGRLKEMIGEAGEDEAGESSTISAQEKSLLINLIHFGELTVQDVMVPRAQIMGVEKNVSSAEIKKHIVEIGHTRIPVYDGSLDAIEGFIHVKDMFSHLASGEAFELPRILRDILFVPPSMRIVDLLLKMRVSGCHIAIVVDEFGGTDGMVTMEDLFEEIVGEIMDEHDGHETTESMRWLGDHVVEVDARTSIEKLEEAFGEKLCDEEIAEDVDSLGGMVFTLLGRIPVRGEVHMLKPTLKAEILQADPRRIRLVRITRITT